MDRPELELACHVRLDFGEGPRLRFSPAGRTFTPGFVGAAARRGASTVFDYCAVA